MMSDRIGRTASRAWASRVPALRRRVLRAGFAVVAFGLAGCASLGPQRETRTVAIDQASALGLANDLRTRNGLGALKVDSRLMRAAATQSAAMAGRDAMDHAVAGRLPGRVEAAGYDWSTTAENIGRGYADYAAAMKGWETSPGHRRNLLNPAVTDIGFAAARDLEGGRIYWTQIFAAPRALRQASRPGPPSGPALFSPGG